MNLKKKQSGFILIASIFLLIFIGALLTIAFSRNEMQMIEADVRVTAQQAFYATESGIEQALFELRKNPNWDATPSVNFTDLPVEVVPGDATTLIGTYSLTAVQGADFNSLPTIWVRSEGKGIFENLRGYDADRVVLARIVVTSPAEFFASTLGDLVIVSGSKYDNDIFGRDVDFKVLGSAPVTEIEVDGNVYHMRDVSGEGDPDVTITGKVEKSPAITFAGVDTAYYKQQAAGGSIINNDTTFSGALNKTSLNAPNGLVYVDGDVTISGDFTEPIMIVASGNIYIEGNITNGADPTTSQLALFAAEDVIIKDSAPYDLGVEAFIMADGQNGTEGVLKAEPVVGGKGILDLKGSIAVRGDVSTGSAINLSVYTERNYIYNEELTNGVLPFLPYIANVIEWREAYPPCDVIPIPANC